jgi:hypothetical protein
MRTDLFSETLYCIRKKEEVKFSLCLIKQYAMKASGGMAVQIPPFPGLCTGWRSIVSFTPRPLYLPEKSPRYPSDRRLGGLHNLSGRLEKRISLPLSGHELRSESLYRLRYPVSPYNKKDD